MKRVLALVVLVGMLGTFGLAAPVRAADDPQAAAQRSIYWLVPRQMDDGSFPGFDAGASADAIFAITSIGADPNGVVKNGNSPVSYLGNQAASYAAKSTAAASKLLLAVVAAGKDPLTFGGQNLVALIVNHYNPQTGRYGQDITGQALALVALASTGQPIPPAAISALNKAQLADGGWSFDGTAATGSDTNTTALAIQALVATGAKGESTAKALNYLKSQQNSDGGFPYAQSSQFGAATDANSTAVVIQALVAAGVDPRAWQQSGGEPISALLALQNANGAFRYQASQADDNDLATAQAIPALLLKPFPLKTVSLSPVVAQPAPASAPLPASLPRTGGADAPVWAVALALLLLAAGGLLKLRRV
jgi:LPXTG-motif cell wall-anchored protein